MIICLYTYVYMFWHVLCDSTFHSHCSGVTAENSACSATAGHDVNVFLQIVRLYVFL